ncbi:MAG TPA: hypothetical protein VFO19_13285, partial [Vicinamibacterales bacterium]|nr:hypothetical protein [Vicinamibacterales bacterium]
RRLEPLRSLALAWLGGCAMFLTLGVITPVDMRHYLAALPALAMLIGIALGALGRHPGWGPGVVAAGLAWMTIQAAISWMKALGGL